MSCQGELVAIFTSPARGETPAAAQRVRAVAGQGLEGDRYFGKRAERQVTLIEAEALEALARDHGLELGPGASRRNLVTRGVPLNHLVGVEFQVGGARLEGVELCEPCGYLERVTGKPVRAPLVHRGGLCARVLADGDLGVGDPVRLPA